MAAYLDASLTPNVKWACAFFVDPRWRFLASSIRLARRVSAPGGMENPKASSSCILRAVLDVTAASKAGRGWSAGLGRAVAWVWRSVGILPACLLSLLNSVFNSRSAGLSPAYSGEKCRKPWLPCFPEGRDYSQPALLALVGGHLQARWK